MPTTSRWEMLLRWEIAQMVLPDKVIHITPALIEILKNFNLWKLNSKILNNFETTRQHFQNTTRRPRVQIINPHADTKTEKIINLTLL